MFHRAIALLAILGLCACSGGDADGSNAVVLAEFQEGQAWSYHARPGEEESIILIGRIENLDGHLVVHIQIQGLSLRNPQVIGGVQRELGHLPISVEALSSSVTVKTIGRLDRESFDEGYGVWQDNRGGIFTLTVGEVIELLEMSIQ
jgi:hypothetical protein